MKLKGVLNWGVTLDRIWAPGPAVNVIGTLVWARPGEGQSTRQATVRATGKPAVRERNVCVIMVKPLVVEPLGVAPFKTPSPLSDA
jgi:hypothetical protein